jgi:hypothetical protein
LTGEVPVGTEGRADVSVLARGLIGAASYTLLTGLFAIRSGPAWAVILLGLATATLVGGLLIANSKPEDRPFVQVLTERDGFGGVIGGALFGALVSGAILFSTVEEVAPPIFVAVHLALVAGVFVFAKKGIVEPSKVLALAERLGWPDVSFSTKHSHSQQSFTQANTIETQTFTVSHRIAGFQGAWEKWVAGLEIPMSDGRNVVSMYGEDVRKALRTAHRELRRIEKG